MKRKMLCMAAMGLIALGSYAQQTTTTVNAGRTTFGVRAGVNFQNITGNDASDDELENDLATGFHVGVNAEIPVGTGFYLQPGVLYSTKGANWSNGSKVKVNYLEVPVNFVYKPTLGTGNLLLGFGPYVAFGMGGKAEDANGNVANVVFNNELDVTEPDAQFRPIDAGGNLLAGYEFGNKFSVQLNAQLGLVNINPETGANDRARWRNTGWGLSLGYRF
ncbi:MAG TPA: porin family protein [Flavisolibacter sp.]